MGTEEKHLQNERVLIIAHSKQETSGWGRIASQVLQQFDKREYKYRAIFDSDTECSVLRPPTSLFNVLRNMRVARRAANDASVVHAFDVWPYALYGFAAVIGTRKKLFITGVGTYSAAPLSHRLRKWLLWPVLWRTEKVLAISKYTAHRMRELTSFKDKFAIVHLGATDLPTPSEDYIRSIKERYEIRGSPVVISVGEVKDRKGQWDTARAIQQLKEMFPEVLYLVVGNAQSEYSIGLREYVDTQNLNAHVRLITDAATDNELAALYASADVFALNSTNDERAHHFEGFGLVFLEAYQFGLPAVGSRNCGIEDAIVDGVTGYLTEQRDVNDIAAKLKDLFSRSIVDVEKNIAQYRASFTWEGTARQYIRHYQSNNQNKI